MRPEQERLVRQWLDTRDPGAVPARLRAAVATIPMAERGARFPIFQGPPIRLPWLHVAMRPVLLALVLLAALVALTAAGYLVLRPPFPPRGLLAYATSLEVTGSTGIRLVAANGTGARSIGGVATNTFDHSPRWSADGRTLLFARNDHLDAFGACGGVGSVVLYDVAAGTERVVATGLRPIDVVEWSPSDDSVAYLYPPPGCGAPAELGVLDIATGRITTSRLGDGIWEIRWVDGAASAARTAPLVAAPPGQPVTPWEVASPDGARVASFPAPGRDVGSHLTVTGPLAEEIDLGAGGAPTWSADGTSLAYVAFVDLPSEYEVYFRDHIAILDVASGRVRTLADAFDADVTTPAGIGPLPRIFWTPDGNAIYWLDGRGGHIVDVASGRTVDLPAEVIGCDDLRWQPTPG